MTRFLPGFPLLFFATNVLAQDATPTDDAAATAATAAAGLLAGACGCIIPLVALAIQAAIAF